MTNIYDLVKNILETDSTSRDSDKRLVWSVCFRLGFVNNGSISYDNFMKAPTFESITRARRKAVELHPELAGNKTVESGRRKKENSRGTFVFREKVPVRQDLSAPVDVMLKLREEFLKKGL